MKILSTVVQYVTLVIIGFLVYLGIRNNWIGRLPHYRLNAWQVVVFGFVCAFTFVNGRYWATKPFSCLKCMTAWITFAFGIYTYGWHGVIFLPIGFTVGAIVERLILRYL